MDLTVFRVGRKWMCFGRVTEIAGMSGLMAVSPESLELVGGWLASCDSMRALKPKPTNHRDLQRIERGVLARRRTGSREFVPPTAAAVRPGGAV